MSLCLIVLWIFVELTLNFIIVVLGKAPKARKNTDGGANPRYRNINKTKAPKGRQNVQLLCKQHIKTLSPRRGFFCCRTTTGGSSLRSGAGGEHPRLYSFAPSVLIYRTVIKFDNLQKHLLLSSLGGGQISTRTYGDKYT